MTCIDTPVSWLRLEQFALDGRDAKIASHVAACPACARCLDEIRVDVVALPVLDVPARRATRPWWHFALPAFALAAAILALLAWPRDRIREDTVTVKGIGEVILGVVRERDGAIRDDAHTFLETDRWKVVLTCPPSASAWVDIDVGGDHPLAPARIACGNRVVVPGAFHLTGSAPNRICVRVAASEGAEPNRACVTIRPER
jgi:hypothetical protein